MTSLKTRKLGKYRRNSIFKAQNEMNYTMYVVSLITYNRDQTLVTYFDHINVINVT